MFTGMTTLLFLFIIVISLSKSSGIVGLTVLKDTLLFFGSVAMLLLSAANSLCKFFKKIDESVDID